MVEMSREELLELAKKWGAEIELQSDQPGFFLSSEEGETEVFIDDIFPLEGDKSVDGLLEQSIAAALATPGTKSGKVKKPSIGFTYFNIYDECDHNIYEVA
ncbi:hypothetical protein [Paenibacillus medicaginis]|uniref:Uncharacterized protein n=1 Tax=Paenibacillus medicaginis TaxID=1470560 RepID=A0ABV5C410_9BACL